MPREKGSGRKYDEAASESVESALHREKLGTLRSGKGGIVTSRKQAIAIGLSEARKAGAQVPIKPQLTRDQGKGDSDEELE